MIVGFVRASGQGPLNQVASGGWETLAQIGNVG